MENIQFQQWWRFDELWRQTEPSCRHLRKYDTFEFPPLTYLKNALMEISISLSSFISLGTDPSGSREESTAGTTSGWLDLTVVTAGVLEIEPCDKSRRR